MLFVLPVAIRSPQFNYLNDTVELEGVHSGLTVPKGVRSFREPV
jgi:hypothetical protein